MKTNVTKGEIKAFLRKQPPSGNATVAHARTANTHANLPSSDVPEPNFKDLYQDVKRLHQDTVTPIPPAPSTASNEKRQAASLVKQQQAEFTFSEGFEGYFGDNDALAWHQGDKSDARLLKRLKRGDFIPEWELDCHGMTKANAKAELAALLGKAYKDNCACVAIMHGHGTGVLKQAIPNYLIQYPHIVAFCQAPKQWGGKATILALINVPDLNRFE